MRSIVWALAIALVATSALADELTWESDPGNWKNDVANWGNDPGNPESRNQIVIDGHSAGYIVEGNVYDTSGNHIGTYGENDVTTGINKPVQPR